MANVVAVRTLEPVDHRKAGDYYFKQFKDPTQPKNLLHLAINEYTKECEISDDADTLAQMAKAYLLDGRLAQAEKYMCKAYLKEDLSDSTRRKLLEVEAYIHFRHGRSQEAREALKRAVAVERPWRTAKLHLGMVGTYLEGIRDRKSIMAWIACLWHLMLGLALFPLSEPLSAVKPTLSVYAVKLLGRFRQTEQTMSALLDLYQQYPGLDLLPIEIGKLYAQQDRYAEAEFWFSRAIHRNPSRDEGYRHLANLYQATYNNSQLAEILSQWLAIRPQSGEIMAALSQALADQPENYDEALRYAKQAILLLKDPVMLANAYSHLGNLYTNMQLLDSAIIAYQSALSINPNSLDIYIQLGTLYHERQEYLLSQKVFEKAMAFSPANAKIYCNLGYLAWMQGDINTAQDYYHKSIALDPTYDIALNNLGVLYLDHIGDIDKAMQLFDQTLFYNPNYALCFYNKGRAFSFLGKTIEAARCFHQAQELNESSHELDNQELTDRIKSLFENSEEYYNTTDM